MKQLYIMIATVLCLAVGTADAAVTTIIGGPGSIGTPNIGNGNFENKTGAVPAPNTGGWPISEMPNWHNLSGGESQTSGTNQGLGGSPEGGYGMWPYHTFVLGNDTGYTVGEAGEVFRVSFYWYGFGGSAGYTGDEEVTAYLFKTTTGTVTDSTTWSGDVTVLGSVSFPISHLDSAVNTNAVYTSVGGDIGETVFLGLTLTNPTLPSPFPRLDIINLTVEPGGVVNLPPEFTADPMSRPAADEGVNYTGSTLAGSATDPEGDALTYSKKDGPGWLQVEDDGTLFGVPGPTVAGMTNSFTVEVSATGGSDTATLNIFVESAPAIPNGWEQFVLNYNLTGNKFDDFDEDGVFDVYEYAHGGNPTNPADTGILPYIEYGAGDTLSFICLETADTNPGISYTAEWTDNLTTGNWNQVWDSEVSIPSVTVPGYNEVTRQISGAANDEIFCRNRLFPSQNRPNILFILADDLGYEDVSFNAPTAGVTPEIHTPELDKLAWDGTIFTSAYVVHPFCGPSRMGLMSGRYPHEFGGPFNLPTDAYLDQGIPVSETLFSKALQDADYYTGIMGKWHLGEEPEHHPNVRGFDEFYGFLGGGQVYWGPYQSSGWGYVRYPEENGVSDSSLTSNDHITDVLTEKGTNFIHQAAATEDPFFLFMSYNAPHTVLVYNGRDQAKPADMDLFPSLEGNRQIYAGLVYGMDRCIGQLVQTLKDTDQYENTLIVFLSDNGGRTDTAGSGKNGALRGRKGDVTEGGFRVPMFMHWPGVIPEGATYDHPVTALDFYPTFARLADTDIPVSQEVDGKDILDAVIAGNSARPGEPIYTVAYSTSAASVGIRQDNWKALKLGTQNWTLYNIDSDISETSDVSGANGTVLSDMVSEGATWSDDHVQPLWWNSTSAEATWNANNMPHYETVFVLP